MSSVSSHRVTCVCLQHTVHACMQQVYTAVQVLNGAIAAALFNLLYDLVLSQKVKWYAMCPVVDFMNHNSSIQVSVNPSTANTEQLWLLPMH